MGKKFGRQRAALAMEFELREEGGEVVQCDSCDCPAPTAGFEWGPPFNAAHDRPHRMLCEFCCTTQASRHTEYPASDEYTRLRAEVWKAAACVFNMLERRQLEPADGARNAWPAGLDHMRVQADRTNFWREATDDMPIAQLPPKPRPTLLARFKRWMRA